MHPQSLATPSDIFQVNFHCDVLYTGQLVLLGSAACCNPFWKRLLPNLLWLRLVLLLYTHRGLHP